MEMKFSLADFEREASNNLRRLNKDEVGPYYSRLIKKVRDFERVLGEISSEQFNHHFLSPNLALLVDSLDCLRLKHSTEGEDRIDFQPTITPFNSGFPTFNEFHLLGVDREKAKEVLTSLPATQALLSTMKWKIRAGESVEHEQILLKRSLYFNKLLETRTLPGTSVLSNPPEFIKTEEGKRYYIMDWCALQSAPFVPVLYRMWFTQNANYAQLHTEGETKGTAHPRLEDFVQQTKSGIDGLTNFATRLNHSIEEIHPKEIRKYTVGPFYDSVTSNSDEMIKAFEGCKDPSALKFKIEMVLGVDIRRKVFKNLLEHARAVVNRRPMEYEVYSDTQLMHQGLIVPTRIKQNLEGDFDEYGNPCRVYGINGGAK